MSYRIIVVDIYRDNLLVQEVCGYESHGSAFAHGMNLIMELGGEGAEFYIERVYYEGEESILFNSGSILGVLCIGLKLEDVKIGPFPMRRRKGYFSDS